MVRRVVRVVVAAGIVTACVSFAGSPAAQAQAAQCRVTFAGVDVAGHGTPRSAIKTSRDATVTVAATTSLPVTRYGIEMRYGRVHWMVAEGTLNPPDTSWTRSVDIRKYAKYGVGVYKVHPFGSGQQGGSFCERPFFVEVDGNPLDTTAGKAAAAAGGVGGILAAGDAIAAANDEQKELDEKYKKDLEKQEGDAARAWAVDQLDKDDDEDNCSMVAWTAFAMTASAMATRRGEAGVMTAVALPRVRVRWRVAVLGLVGGLLLGLGTLVLLQQYAVAYPTDLVTVGTVGGGLLVSGVLLPTYSRHNARTKWLAGVLATIPEGAPGTPAPASLWTPTHVVPDGGLPTFVEHDTAQSAGADLVAGLPVQVVETWGDWARVRCENTWECWVDGRHLVPR